MVGDFKQFDIISYNRTLAHPRTKNSQKTQTRMFLSALFVISPDWELSECSFTVRYSHVIKYYVTMKRP